MIKIKNPKLGELIEKEIPLATVFCEKVLETMLEFGDKGADLINIKASPNSDKIIILFGDVSNKKKLEKVIRCINEAMDCWKAMIENSNRLTELTAYCSVNAWEKIDEKNSDNKGDA